MAECHAWRSDRLANVGGDGVSRKEPVVAKIIGIVCSAVMSSSDDPALKTAWYFTFSSGFALHLRAL